MSHVAAFILTALLIELTPGPNMGYLAAIASRDGVRAGLAVVLGVAAGLAVLVAAAITGLAAVVLADRRVFDIVRWAGVTYMFWLALDAWRQGDADTSAQAQVSRMIPLVRRGFVTNVLNVKAVLFLATVMPTFIETALPHPERQVVVLGTIYVAIATAVHAAIVLAAARASAGGKGMVSGRSAARFYAGVLLILALWLANATAREGPAISARPMPS